MRNHARHTLIAGLALAFIALFSACATGSATARGDAAPIPAEALGWVLIADPEAALADLDAFWKAGGFDAFTDGKGPLDLLMAESEQPEAIKKTLAEIDSSRPWVMALLPPPEKGAEPVSAIYLPLRNGQASFDVLAASSSDSEGSSALVGTWAVYYPKGEAPSQAPAHILELPGRDERNPGAIIAAGEVGALLAAYGEDIDTGLDELTESLDTMDAGLYDYDSFFKTLRTTANQFSRIEMIVHAGKAGLDLGFRATPKPGSEASAYGANFAKGAAPLRYLDRIEDAALFSGAWSSNPEAMTRLGADYLKALGTKDLLGPDYPAYAENYAKAVGSAGAMSFDMGLASDLMTRISGVSDMQAIGSILDKSITIDIRTMTELRDAAAWRALLASSAKPGIYGSAFHKVLDEAGMDFKIEHKARSLEGRDYDTISFNLVLGSKLLSSMEKAEARSLQSLVDKLMAKFAMTSSVEGKLGYSATGGTKGVSALISGRAPSAPAGEGAGWKHLLAETPKSLRFAGKFSTQRLMELILPFASGLPFEFDPADFDGFYLWLSADETAFGVGYYMPMGDIRAFAELGASTLKLFSGGDKAEGI